MRRRQRFQNGIGTWFSLMATDISKEAITYCKQQMPRYQNHFSVLITPAIFKFQLLTQSAPVAELADAPDLGSVLYVILLLITVFAVFIYED